MIDNETKAYENEEMCMNDKKHIAMIFKAFSDENRIKILSLLQTGEKCACTLLDDLQIGQSTLSHHMKILCEANIVHARREGKWTYYSIDKKGTEMADELLKQITMVYSNEKACTCEEKGE